MAANAGLIMFWSRVAPGYEARANALWEDVLGFMARKASKKEIESFEPAVVDATGSHLNGFMIVRGELDQIEALRRDEDYKKMTAKADYVLMGFGIAPLHIGKSLMERMQLWRSEITH